MVVLSICVVKNRPAAIVDTRGGSSPSIKTSGNRIAPRTASMPRIGAEPTRRTPCGGYVSRTQDSPSAGGSPQGPGRDPEAPPHFVVRHRTKRETSSEKSAAAGPVRRARFLPARFSLSRVDVHEKPCRQTRPEANWLIGPGPPRRASPLLEPAGPTGPGSACGL
jgi:hypothetical protein